MSRNILALMTLSVLIVATVAAYGYVVRTMPLTAPQEQPGGPEPIAALGRATATPTPPGVIPKEKPGEPEVIVPPAPAPREQLIPCCGGAFTSMGVCMAIIAKLLFKG